MFGSIQWRLVASYIGLTLLTVALVGVLSLWLIGYYVTQQEERSLMANAEAIANQASLFMGPITDQMMLEKVAHTSAFLGNARVRILDADQGVLADSGAEHHVEPMLLIGPILREEGILSEEELDAFIISSLEEEGILFPWPDSLPGRTIAKVRQTNDIWGSQLTFEFENEVHDSFPSLEGVGASQEEERIEVDSLPSSENTIISVERITVHETNTVRSARTRRVPIGDPANPLGYVELSNSPDLSTEALTTAGQAFGLAAIGATLLAAIVGLFVSRRLTAPIHKLTEATDCMSSGDLSVRAEVESQDEIGQLSTQFNEMAARLEESFAELAAERDTLRRFIADASHELRTPITALKTFNELLMGPAANDSAAQLEFLSESQAQLERLEWITHNLLDLSRLEGGLVQLEVEQHDLADLLHAAAAPFRPLAQERHIQLQINSPASAPPQAIYCDRARIVLALTNLLNNALKFTPPHGQITLGAAKTNKHLHLWVQDTGSGIHPADQPHIFERFYRGRDNRTPGSGLGLAIVQSIVQAHRGHIRLESQIGKGTKFIIELPMSS
ncbi:MAG: sensor histidine kinase [Ardenticatenaceae bacterium]